MTTATCQSLAHAIVHRAEQPEEVEGETDAVESADAPLSETAPRGAEGLRKFASVLEDHFPPVLCASRNEMTSEF